MDKWNNFSIIPISLAPNIFEVSTPLISILQCLQFLLCSSVLSLVLRQIKTLKTKFLNVLL